MYGYCQEKIDVGHYWDLKSPCYFTYQKKFKGSKNFPSLLSYTFDTVPQEPGWGWLLSVHLDQRSDNTTTHELVLTL